MRNVLEIPLIVTVCVAAVTLKLAWSFISNRKNEDEAGALPVISTHAPAPVKSASVKRSLSRTDAPAFVFIPPTPNAKRETAEPDFAAPAISDEVILLDVAPSETAIVSSSAEEVSVEEARAEETLKADVPVEEVTVPVEEVKAEVLPQTAPVEVVLEEVSAPTVEESAPIEEMKASVEEESAPVQEVKVVEAPVEESKVEVAPQEEAPVAPQEEAPVAPQDPFAPEDAAPSSEEPKKKSKKSRGQKGAGGTEGGKRVRARPEPLMGA
eukprot:CAMPEP_0184651404 /NCGR_PEP_ID=MMETSP0308-20130426/8994_1 /TAXON_ID=38269 /ORGANISM="Gloeochaete witrockiana, Strain SAG 46.84" /LENGTH=267 /DNA_ID=CAMNT_0027085581 /DNA_START=86 /DNA_END=889 /DNA_ORIENTATION=+